MLQDRAAALAFADVRCTLGTRHAFHLSIPDFAVAPGEAVFVSGPSGSGKSTLLALAAGILAPEAGSVVLGGTELARLSAMARDQLRGDAVGVIFQTFNLLPYLTPLDNVVLPLSFSPARLERLGGAGAARREALRLMAAMGLDQARLASVKSAMLSIGQQQRVAAARALLGSPSLILADEPTSALDADHSAGFVALLLAEARRAGAATVFVSHDLGLADAFDRHVRMSEIAPLQVEAA